MKELKKKKEKKRIRWDRAADIVTGLDDRVVAVRVPLGARFFFS
jgi:hypothetical protein